MNIKKCQLFTCKRHRTVYIETLKDTYKLVKQTKGGREEERGEFCSLMTSREVQTQTGKGHL